jgi:RNA polymerase sigma factor (sigma-70 family)
MLRETEHVEVDDEEQLIRRLAAIARNNIRDAARRRREQGFESLSMTWNDPSAGAGDAASPRTQISRREQAILLANALARVPEADRRVVELRGFEHLSFAEIAQRLGRGEDAVRKQYHRAILVLGRRLSGAPRRPGA